MPSFTVFLNDASGSVTKETTTEIEKLLRIEGENVRFEMISEPNLAERVSAAMGRGDVVVAGGGDGTIASIAGHLIGTDATFGVLPLGTLNHFSKDLGISQKLEEASKVLLNGSVRRVDTAQVNDVVFLNNSSLGLYAKLVIYRERLQSKGHSKWVALFKASIYILKHYHRVRVELNVEGKKLQRSTPLAFVGNNPYKLEGWQIGTRDTLEAGTLQLAVTTAKRPLEFLGSALRTLFGGAASSPIELFTASEIEVTSDRKSIEVSADGEVHQLTSPLRFQIVPKSLNVLVPAA